uniref:Uncharacterized protein n=1 Tax=Rhizophora mucronata TaxID=61149 RepID=A0A2P2LPS5_RHIMU
MTGNILTTMPSNHTQCSQDECPHEIGSMTARTEVSIQICDR